MVTEFPCPAGLRSRRNSECDKVRDPNRKVSMPCGPSVPVESILPRTRSGSGWWRQFLCPAGLLFQRNTHPLSTKCFARSASHEVLRSKRFYALRALRSLRDETCLGSMSCSVSTSFHALRALRSCGTKSVPTEAPFAAYVSMPCGPFRCLRHGLW